MADAHLLPVWIPNLEGRRLLTCMKDGVPRFFAVEGIEPDSGRGLTAVTFEIPEWFGIRGKSALEQMHLDRLLADYRLAHRKPLFEAVAHGDDPPDFTALGQSGGRVGVELTQLLLEDRRRLSGQFRELRDAVLSRPTSVFSAIQGTIVYMSFGDTETDGPPLKKKSSLPEIVSALESLQPTSVPAVAPLPDTISLDDVAHGKRFKLSAARVPAPLDTDFFRTCGFEIAITQTTSVFHNAAWQIFLDRVNGHDRPTNDNLVVSLCAPVKYGHAYLSDAILGGVVLGIAETRPVETEHISQVWLHDWQSRGIWRLKCGRPGVEHICGGPLTFSQ